MSGRWQYQIRIDLDEASASLARHDLGSPALKPLVSILDRHHATMVCQFAAFAGFVAEAEEHRTIDDPLYKWTKATIEDPVKARKYLRSFAIHIDGASVYAREKADALEAELRPLVGGGLVTRLSKHDTNPANNPQPPAR